MNPYHKHDLQVPTLTSEGFLVSTSNGEILIHDDGNYSGLEFTGIDFSFLTVKADFSKATFRHCLFNLTDLSGGNFSDASIHDCIMISAALMWTESSNLKISSTKLNDIRFYASNLQRAQIEAEMDNVRFNHVNLNGACITHSAISECEFTDATCTDMTISHTSLDEVTFNKCDLRWLQVKDSYADFLKINDSNLSGSTWVSVFSMTGYWGFDKSLFTAARFSMCNAARTYWGNSSLHGVEMERCNWFKSYIDRCHIIGATLTSVGLNETKFSNTMFCDVQGRNLRLRYAEFENCEIIDSTVADSHWEFCDVRFVFPKNFSVVNPSYSEGTLWHEGYVPANSPNPTPEDAPNPNVEEKE